MKRFQKLIQKMEQVRVPIEGVGLLGEDESQKLKSQLGDLLLDEKRHVIFDVSAGVTHTTPSFWDGLVCDFCGERVAEARLATTDEERQSISDRLKAKFSMEIGGVSIEKAKDLSNEQVHVYHRFYGILVSYNGFVTVPVERQVGMTSKYPMRGLDAH